MANVPRLWANAQEVIDEAVAVELGVALVSVLVGVSVKAATDDETVGSGGSVVLVIDKNGRGEEVMEKTGREEEVVGAERRMLLLGPKTERDDELSDTETSMLVLALLVLSLPRPLSVVVAVLLLLLMVVWVTGLAARAHADETMLNGYLDST